jgi:hypothetical protein
VRIVRDVLSFERDDPGGLNWNEPNDPNQNDPNVSNVPNVPNEEICKWP